MNARNTFIYLIVFIPLAFFIPVIYALMQKPLILFPWKQRVYRINAYSDEGVSVDETASTIDAFNIDVNAITVEYTLRDGVTYPYAGMYFSTEINKKYIDLSGYDILKLKISVSLKDVYQIKLKTHIDGYSAESDSNTLCPLEKAIVLEDYMNEYIIPLTEFEFLDWWFNNQQMDPLNYNEHKLLKKTAMINIQKTKKMNPGMEEKNRFIIKEFSFYKSFTMLYILCGAGFFLTMGTTLVIIFAIRGKKGYSVNPLQLEYNPVAMASYSDVDTRRLETFIMEHYTDPGMSVEMLYTRTGLSRRRIALLIKKKYNLSFKQLLNKIRLTEAARLLKETDRNITDIAMILGFSSSSYFFQVFKSAYNISPTDYRKHP
ncbi:MAG: helix-turn-helix transcriptional regulator [Spirochaetales bacterium]|nr:helix-turn-helix transcriptional regulator [Spirochaetales bacterium]